MPVAGRKPKPEGQAVTRHKPTHDWTEVVDEPFSAAPEMPAARPDGRPWQSWTVRKWGVWSVMPHCSLWGGAEWDYAMDALELHARFLDGSTPAATELRNREKVLGTTVEYRRDLRIKYVEAKSTETAENVTSMDDYRDL